MLRTALLATLFTPLLSAAACDPGSHGRLEDYTGDIAGKYKIQMTLVFEDNGVKGQYFYHAHMKDIALRGASGENGSITIDELDATGKVVAGFSGKMPDDCSRFDGTWKKVGASRALPVQLRHSGSVSGKLGQRYGVAGDGSNEIVHANAYKFWLGVKNGDKKAVAASMAYPVRAQVGGQKRQFRNAKEFIASYDAIFSPEYRQAVLNSVPRNMSASWRGIMLGERGEVWLDDMGKVKALNNP